MHTEPAVSPGVSGSGRFSREQRATRSWHGLLLALVASGVATVAAALLLKVFDLANVVILFLFTVVLVSLRVGRLAGALAALLGVLSFDFFFVPPVFSFHVSDTQYLFTFALTLAVALITGQLAARMREGAARAVAGEQRATTLAHVAGQLSAAASLEAIHAVCRQTIAPVFQTQGGLWMPDMDAGGDWPHGDFDVAVARWTYERRRRAECVHPLTDMQFIYVPVISAQGPQGVLALWREARSASLKEEQRQQLDACCALVGQALARIHFAELAREAQVRMEGERFRHTLLASISHDLKTPLTAIRGMAEALDIVQVASDEASRGLARAIGRQADALHRLVCNLLDLARMQEHGVHLQRDWHAMDEVIGAAVDSTSIDIKGRTITVKAVSSLPLVLLDACLFERVLVNLLDNAIKYTPECSRIDICAFVSDGMLHVCVEDDGPGLPHGLSAEQLFTPFVRGVRESSICGVGLGLALCRSIVEAHGGSIDAQARQPHGLHVRLMLPLHAAPPMEPECTP